MFLNPAITTALAEQHRRDLITQARTARLAPAPPARAVPAARPARS
jgi:hypothetical protein